MKNTSPINLATSRLVLSFFLSGFVVISGQSAAGRQHFEVSSVKATDGSLILPQVGAWRGGPIFGGSPERLTVSNVTVRSLIVVAYSLRWDQSDLVLGPASLDKTRYAVEAKIPPGATPEQFLGMLQNLLAERFGLAVHWENRDMPVYEMTVAKGGAKLKEPEMPPTGLAARPAAVDTKSLPRDADGWQVLPPGIPFLLLNTRSPGPPIMLHRITARVKTVADLILELERLHEFDHPIVDKTGLTGAYDFILNWAELASTANENVARMVASGEINMDEAAASVAGMDIAAALDKQLGLKMVSARGPVKVLVVDKVSTAPTEN